MREYRAENFALVFLISALFFGVAVAFLPYWMFLALAVFGLMVISAFFAPTWAVLLLLLLASGLVPPQLTPNLPLLGGTIKAEDLFLLLLVLMTFFKVFIKENNVWRSSIIKPIYFFGFLVVLSLLVGVLFFNNQIKYVAYEFRVCAYWLFGIVLAVHLKSEKDIIVTVKFVVFISLILAIVVIVQSITGWHILASARVENLDSAGFVSTEVSRSTFGGYQNFVVLSILIVLSMLSEREIRPVLAVPVLLILVSGIVVTFGRGVWGAAFISVVVMAIGLGWKNFVRISSSSIVIGLMLLIVVFSVKPVLLDAVIQRVSSVEREINKGESWGWRQAENEFALVKISKYPIAGIGLGGEYQPIRNRFMSPEQTRMMHNSYLYLILKFGLAGIVFPIWFCFAVWYECRRLVLVNSLSKYRTLVISIGAAMLMPVLTGFTQPEWMEHKGVIFMATLFGLLVSIARLETKQAFIQKF